MNSLWLFGLHMRRMHAHQSSGIRGRQVADKDLWAVEAAYILSSMGSKDIGETT